jgi:hydroxymethylbilane synthase
MPIGGLCRLTHGVVDLIGVVASLDGSQLVRHRKLGPRQAASDVGRDLGEQLLRDGAAEILAEARAEGSRIADPHGP